MQSESRKGGKKLVVRCTAGIKSHGGDLAEVGERTWVKKQCFVKYRVVLPLRGGEKQKDGRYLV
jgi:hypothetical protein